MILPRLIRPVPLVALLFGLLVLALPVSAAPAAPATLSATTLKATSFTLTWSAAAGGSGGIAGYDVFRDGVPVGSTTTARTFAVTGLVPTTTYSMTVTARDGAGEVSPVSSALAVTTPADTTVPTRPTYLAVTDITTTSCTLTWTGSTDNVGVTGYNLYRSGVLLGSTPGTTFAVTGLVPDSTNSLTVRAVDAAGNLSSASVALSVRMLALPPSPPTGLAVTSLKATSFTLTWLAASGGTGGIAGYDVYRDGALVGSTTTARTFAITGLAPTTDTLMTVFSRDTTGNVSVSSETLVVTTPADTTPPTRPADLAATDITTTSLALTWTGSTDNVGVTGYNIYRNGVQIGSSVSTQFVVTGLAPDSTNNLTVRAVDAAGNLSAASVALSVRMVALPPSTPTGLVLTNLKPASFTVTWSASTGGTGGIAGYEVYLDGMLVGSPTRRSLTISGLIPQSTYSLAVLSYDSIGNRSVLSEPLAVVTPADTTRPTAPKNLSAAEVTSTDFLLNWTASTDNVGVTSYEVYRNNLLIGTTPITSFRVIGLTASTLSSMRLKAKDAAGNLSAFSTVLAVTTSAPPNVPPTVALIYPAADAVFTLPYDLTLSATATDSDGTITKIEFFDNGVLLGEATTLASTNTFTFPHTFAVPGVHALVARATDNQNATTDSAPVVITVENPNSYPVVTLTTPVVGAAPAFFTLSADVTDADGAITKVEFYEGSNLLGEALAPTVAPSTYAFPLTLFSTGTYTLTVVATDNSGAQATSEIVAVVVPFGPAGLPFVANFEATEGYRTGALNGQLSWFATSGVGVVPVLAPVGQQEVSIPAAQPVEIFSHDFSAEGVTPVFVDFVAQPVAGADPASAIVFSTPAAQVALVGATTVAELWLFEGAGSGWHSTGKTIPIDANGRTLAQIRLTTREDYVTKKWDLYLEGRMVAADVAFAEASATALTDFSVNGHATVPSAFDTFYAGAENPLFADTDHDGMDDAWETSHGLDPTINDRESDLDEDGGSNIQEYRLGTEPNTPRILPDSDGNGLLDTWERQYFGRIGNDPNSDPDGDGLSNIQEAQRDLDPIVSDTDGDGIADGTEVSLGMNPLVADAEVLPGKISGLRLLLKADVGLTTDTNGRVSRWADQSGLGNHAVQSEVSNQPTWVENSLNENPVVRFDGVNRYFSLKNLMNGATAGEVFLVLRVANDPATTTRGLWAFGASQAQLYPHTDGTVYEDWGSVERRNLGNPVQLLTDFHLYNISSSSSGWSGRINGKNLLSTSTNSVHFPPVIYLGRNAGDPYWGYSSYAGDIAEIIVYDRVLGAAEREAVATYLVGKYALPSVPIPSAPTILSAAAVSSSQVSLTWSKSFSNAEVVYAIERQTGNGDFVKVAELSDTQSFLDHGLDGGTTYSYRIRARTYAGASLASATVSVTTSLTGLAMPLTGVRLWLKGDTGVVGETGRVAIWQDQSGRQSNATQNTLSQQPTLQDGALNGLPAVDFYPFAYQLFQLPNFMAGATAGEAFVVLKAVPSSVRRSGLWRMGPINNDSGYYPSDNGALYDSFGSTTSRNLGLPTSPVTEYQIFNVSSEPGSWIARLNGAVLYHDRANTVGFHSAPILGHDGGAPFNGQVAELLIYDHVLSAQERESVGRYLSGKYSLPAISVPTAPTDLGAVAVSPTQVSLTWTTTVPMRGGVIYTIERRSGSGSFVSIAEVTDTLTYLDNGLSAGTVYSYRINARTYAGASVFSSPVEVAAMLSGAELPANGVRLWLKADAGIFGETGQVHIWPDQSGLGNNAYQNVLTQQPLLQLGALNGRPTVKFTQTSYQLLLLPNLMANAAAGESFVVLKASVLSNRHNGLWRMGGPNNDSSYHPANGGALYESFGSTVSRSLGFPPTPLTNFHLFNVSSETGSWVARFNGAQIYHDATNTVAFHSVPCLGYDGSPPFDGQIAEVLVFDRVLGTDEREAINLYLSRKYALGLPSIVTGGSSRDSNLNGYTDADDIARGFDPYDDDVDGDGVINRTEILYGSDPFSADTDKDGIDDRLDAFPLDPLRWDSANTAPSLTAISGDRQVTQKGTFNLQPFVVRVMSSNGSAPLVNAPVSFTVQSGGGWMAASAGSAAKLAATLNLSTDADGWVRAYYMQPGSMYVASTIQFRAGTAQHLFSTESTVLGDWDGNYLADPWEILHFPSLGTDPNADPDGDGLTNLQEFVQGSDPHDPYNGTAPQLSIVSGDNQYAAAGQFTAQPIVVEVRDPSGVAPLINAVVDVAVQTEGGALASTNTGNPITSVSLKLVTDASGRVQYYYRQPAVAGLLSTITVSAGTATQRFVHAHNFVVTPPDDSDGNGFADAWEQLYFGHLGVDSNADPDEDGLTNLQESQTGRNPTKGEQPDVTGAVNLRVYSPIR